MYATAAMNSYQLLLAIGEDSAEGKIEKVLSLLSKTLFCIQNNFSFQTPRAVGGIAGWWLGGTYGKTTVMVLS